eukprot:TRINITY_DN3472_c0_g1_i1.p1 TRINITY_DN3472_c0_g1~~TRINITY_DN3472_c0_g1_i1.p1  ORF type:complete len:446 (-),score=44.87 TRINITY_DN3472_c0_g1_i1:22-1335(-)
MPPTPLLLLLTFISLSQPLNITFSNGTQLHYNSPSLFSKWNRFLPHQTFNKKIMLDVDLNCHQDRNFSMLLNDTVSDYVYFGLFDGEGCDIAVLFYEKILFQGFAGVVIGFASGGFQEGIASRSAFWFLPGDLEGIFVPVVELRDTEYYEIAEMYLLDNEMTVDVADGEENMYLTYMTRELIIIFQIVSWGVCFLVFVYTSRRLLKIIMSEAKNKKLLIFLSVLLLVADICMATRTLDPFLTYRILHNVFYYFLFIVQFWSITTSVSGIAFIFHSVLLTKFLRLGSKNTFNSLLRGILYLNISIFALMIGTWVMVLFYGSNMTSILIFLVIAISLFQSVYFIVNLIKIASSVSRTESRVKLSRYYQYIIMVIAVLVLMAGYVYFIIVSNAEGSYIFQFILNSTTPIIIICITIALDGSTHRSRSSHTSTNKRTDRSS